MSFELRAISSQLSAFRITLSGFRCPALAGGLQPSGFRLPGSDSRVRIDLDLCAS